MIEASLMLLRAILHRNLECHVRESRQIGSGQTGDGKSEHQHAPKPPVNPNHVPRTVLQKIKGRVRFEATSPSSGEAVTPGQEQQGCKVGPAFARQTREPTRAWSNTPRRPARYRPAAGRPRWLCLASKDTPPYTRSPCSQHPVGLQKRQPGLSD